jgi:hypothetical protein
MQFTEDCVDIFIFRQEISDVKMLRQRLTQVSEVGKCLHRKALDKEAIKFREMVQIRGILMNLNRLLFKRIQSTCQIK